jgi:hypothetical protein
VNHGTCFSTREEKISYDTAERERLKTLPHRERLAALTALETRCGAALTDFDGDRAVYAPLSWTDVGQMAPHAIMFGAHTESHPILSTLPRAEAAREIERSLSVLEQHCTASSSVFAYPNGQPGDMTEETRALVAEAGFTAAVTTIPGWNTSATDPFMLRRFTLDASDSFELFVLTVTGTRHVITSLFRRYAKRG